MYGILSIATLALSALSASNALVIPRVTAPSTYRTDILEPYADYNARYMAIGCQSKHNTAFFDACCHPLKKGETVENNRPAECRVGASSSSAAPTPTSAAAQPSASTDPEDDGDDGDCEDEPEPSEAPATTAAPSTSQAPVHTSAPVVHTSAPATSAAPTSATPSPTPAAPKPETTKAAPTSNQAAPAPTKAAPAPAPADSQVNTGGFATFFLQNGVAGACGTVHSDNDLIAAIDQDRYGNSGAKSSLCGKKVQITNTNNGKQVTVTIVDDCPTCKNSNSIDLSKGAFTKIATEAEGMVPISWKFL